MTNVEVDSVVEATAEVVATTVAAVEVVAVAIIVDLPLLTIVEVAVVVEGITDPDLAHTLLVSIFYHLLTSGQEGSTNVRR